MVGLTLEMLDLSLESLLKLASARSRFGVFRNISSSGRRGIQRFQLQDNFPLWALQRLPRLLERLHSGLFSYSQWGPESLGSFSLSVSLGCLF